MGVVSSSWIQILGRTSWPCSDMNFDFSHSIRLPPAHGLRDRALVVTLAYTFARIAAVVNLKLADYFPSGKRYPPVQREGRQRKGPPGRRGSLVVSTLLFTLFSVLCGLSATFPLLLVSRVLQGATAGPMIPAIPEPVAFKLSPGPARSGQRNLGNDRRRGTDWRPNSRRLDH